MTKKVRAQVTAPGSEAEKGPAAKVAQTGMIRARVSANLKVEAESILNQIGLSASDAIRIATCMRNTLVEPGHVSQGDR